MNDLIIVKAGCNTCRKDNNCEYKKYHKKFAGNLEGLKEQFKDKIAILVKTNCRFYEEV